MEECRVRIETVKRSIAAALSEEPIRAQFALISRFAERKRLPYDSVANVWIRANSGHFRTLWDDGERDLDEIERKLHQKTGY